MLVAERKVFLTGSRGAVDDAGTLFRADILPGDDVAIEFRHGRQIVKRAVIALAHEVGTLAGAHHLMLAANGVANGIGGHPVLLAVLGNQAVFQFRVDAGHGVDGEGPWRGRPHHQAGIVVLQRELHEHRQVGALLVALGDDLVLTQSGATTRAPGHDIVALVDPIAIVTGLKEVPDGVIVLIRHRVIAVVPIHEITETFVLLRDACGIGEHALLAALDEVRNTVLFDFALVLQAEFLLDLHFHPQALAIEAILEALFLAEHVVVPLEEILVAATPGMVHTHRIVGGDRAIDETEGLRRAIVAGKIGSLHLGIVPKLDDLSLKSRKIDLGGNRAKCGGFGWCLFGIGHYVVVLLRNVTCGRVSSPVLTDRSRASGGVGFGNPPDSPLRYEGRAYTD